MCEQEATGSSRWSAVVQLRQKVCHRRSFLYLEQLILKHQMHQECAKIQLQPDGIDFFFLHRMHGLRFLEFVQSKVPANRKDAMQLVTMDVKSNTAEIHHTYSAEIAPICREDLVYLPKKVSATMGGLGPIVICFKVNANIVFLDPFTLQSGELMGSLYWKFPFKSLATSRQLLEFFVIDIVVLEGMVNGKLQLAEATVCLSSEIGHDREWIVRTHLGNILKPGDYAKGYLLTSLNSTSKDFDSMISQGLHKGDVLLAHKGFSRKSHRRWNLQFLTKEEDMPSRHDEDVQNFMDDIERDPEYRSEFIVYDTKTEKNDDSLSANSTTNDESEWESCGMDE